MSAVFNNGQKDGLPAGSGDLRALRKRLWLRSSMLVCSILVFALAAAWVASAFSARDANNVALQNVMTDSLNRGSLMEAYEGAKSDVPQAFAGLIESSKEEAGDWKPTATAPDTYYSLSGPVQSPFSLAVFEGGSMAFLVPPHNVISGDGDPLYGAFNWCESALEELTNIALSNRADAGKRPKPQYIKVQGMTWKCATEIAVTSPRYSKDATDDSGVSLYSDGRLEGCEKDGYLAARVYAFVDITSSVIYLRRMAMFLAAVGVVGCAVLVLVCRRIIDRALVPVAESQARQREFLIKASHELKTPMASLSSNLDALVANSAETVASQERWTKNMREDIDELADRTCKLLDLVTDPERGDSKA